MVLQPSGFLAWEPTICLRCSLGQVRRLNVATKRRAQKVRPPVLRAVIKSAPSVRILALPLLRQRHDRQQQRYIHSSGSSSNLEAPDEDFQHFQPLSPPSRLHSKTSTSSDNAYPRIEKKLDIRSRLRKWHTEKNVPPPLHPDQKLHKGQLLNYLTRPEDLLNEELENNAHNVEDLENPDSGIEESLDLKESANFIQDLDRTARKLQQHVADGDAHPALLNRGDLVELTSYSSYASHFAIYLGVSGTGIYQFFSIHDLLISRDFATAAFDFHVSRFVTPETLELLQPYLPKEITKPDEIRELVPNMPATVTAPLLDRLIKFRDEADKVYREISSKLAKAHTLLAHPSEVVYMTLEEIAQEISKSGDLGLDARSQHVLSAIHQTLMKQVFGFFRMSPKFYFADRYIGIMPQNIARSAERVQTYVRAYQEECALLAGGFEVPNSISNSALLMRQFIHKSRRLVQQSRKLRRATPQGQPLCCEPLGEAGGSNRDEVVQSTEFTDSDRDFIRIIALSSLSHAFKYHPTLGLVPGLIIRATGIYEDGEIPEHAPRSFLIDIGVLDPFSHTESFDLKAWHSSQSLARDLNSTLAKIEASSSVETAGDLYDSMKMFRKDWGNLVVYCIDKLGTLEVDDGISLEPVPGSPEHMWIHVHIAHISAYISADHILGRAARQFFATLYTPSARVPMLPSWASAAFSLGLGTPVLTFSALLDGASNVLQTKIQPGRIHNTMKIAPEAIDKEVFGLDSSDREVMSFHVGRKPENSDFTASTKRAPLSEEDKTSLRTLYEFCNRFIADRPLQTHDTRLALVSAYVSHPRGTPPVSALDLAPLQAQFSTSDPYVGINIRERIRIAQEEPSRAIVEQAMLLAGRVAGAWAAARNIPLMFSGTQPRVDDLAIAGSYLKEQIRVRNKPQWDLAKFIKLYASALYSARPVSHSTLGFKSWAKVTSPLRRYTDLLCHWQIDAALREEHRTGASLVGQSDTSYLPFQLAEMERNALFCRARETNAVLYNRKDRLHWHLYAIGRAFYCNEAAMPDPLLCEVRPVGYLTAREREVKTHAGRILGLEITCDFVAEEGEDGNMVEDGDWWEVRIHQVDLAMQKISVVPVQRVQSAEESKDAGLTA